MPSMTTALAPRRRHLRGEHIALGALLAGTIVFYLWDLSVSGYANEFYAAAAQAGSQSWKAWLFGSLDAGNAITVDKPPAALWAMGISVRIFGLSPWSVLVPQVLMGAATVGLVYATVRRVVGPVVSWLAGAATAVTPVAVLMFRFDNPDALLLLLLVGAGYAVLRAVEAGRGRWLMLAGALVGLAFLTKLLQGFLVVPVFAAVYLFAAPTTLRKRVVHLLGSLAALAVTAGWWVALVALTPAGDRPFLDGTTNDSIVQLVMGYNGVGRLTGHEVGGHGNDASASHVGLLRMVTGVSGGMVGWLVPAGVLLGIAALVALRRAPRTDPTRAALLLTGGTAAVTGAVFSNMHGIYHDYYTVALAPWIAMTAVMSAGIVWRRRDLPWRRGVVALTVTASALWAWHLLGQSGKEPYTALRWVVLLLGLAAAAASAGVHRLGRRGPAGVLLLALVAIGAGPVAYSVQTLRTGHHGAIVDAGPYVRKIGNSLPNVGRRLPRAPLTDLLKAVPSSATWAAATVGSELAATFELASGRPVIAIGGFNGSTPSPTLAQFQSYVAAGRIGYFLPGRLSDIAYWNKHQDTEAAQIASWVEGHYALQRAGTGHYYYYNLHVPGAA